jgi:hypothetical protein
VTCSRLRSALQVQETMEAQRCYGLDKGRDIASSQSGSSRAAWLSRQDAAGVELGVTAFGGWVPSDLRRFLPLAVFLTCLAEMVFLPTRFFFDSAILSPDMSRDAKDTCGAHAQSSTGSRRPVHVRASGVQRGGQPRSQGALRSPDESRSPRTMIQRRPVVQHPRQREEQPCGDKHRDLLGQVR